MCRLTAYYGPPLVAADLVTRPNRSITKQSFAARERKTGEHGYLNGDGFGLGWYPMGVPNNHPDRVEGEPCVFTHNGPAWNNKNLHRLARNTVSPLVFAHVRAATPGMVVCDCSCHPFEYGRFMWMHNGNIGGFHKVRRRLLALLNDDAFAFAVRNGSSDSALCFALFLNDIKDPTKLLTPDDMRSNVERVIALIDEACEAEDIQETSMLNFVITDGDTMVATRYLHATEQEPQGVAASLYFATGTSYECVDPEKGSYKMGHSDRRETTVIVTSEPLTEKDTDWVEVPQNFLLLTTSNKHVLLSEIGATTCPSTGISTCLASLAAPPCETETLPLPCTSGSLVHAFQGHEDSVLSMAVHGQLLFTGSQDATISAWSLETGKHVAALKGHMGSVLSLIAFERDGKPSLFSAASDNCIRQWEATEPFGCVLLLEFPGHGDVLSLRLCGDYLFAGFQDTNIRRITLNSPAMRVDRRRPGSPTKRIRNSMDPPSSFSAPQPTIEYRVFEPTNGCGANKHPASLRHCSYVYAMVECGPYMVSCGGDCFVKLWDTTTRTCAKTLAGHNGSVMSLASFPDGKTFVSGSRDKTVRVWDVDALCVKRTLRGHRAEVLSVALSSELGLVFSGSADGKVLAWSAQTFELLAHWQHDASVQTLEAVAGTGTVCCGLGNAMAFVWKPELPCAKQACCPQATSPCASGFGTMQDMLARFVTFRSVSGNHQVYGEECWQAAKFLQLRLLGLGCDNVELLRCGDGRNPVVYGRLVVDPQLPYAVVYGHYDVMPSNEPEWETDPWKLNCINGQLFARGATDDKGPIVATLFAIRDLKAEGKLRTNIAFVYEGEEENRSEGFRDAVKAIKTNLDKDHSDVSMVFVSNNYWIGEEKPCVTFGMRGMIKLLVTVKGPSQNLHSGVDGGAVVEPLWDLVSLLAGLVDNKGRVLADGFYDDVEGLSEDQAAFLGDVEFDLGEYQAGLGVGSLTESTAIDVLRARWCLPTMSVNSVRTSNVDDLASVIPCSATATISVRHVPNQSVEVITQLVTEHLHKALEARRSPNKLEVEAPGSGDWWLGDPHDRLMVAASDAVEQVWGQRPSFVREGGTMPITSFLMDVFEAEAVHLPLGQASDHAHLANEKLSLENFVKGKDVIKAFFELYGR